MSSNERSSPPPSYGSDFSGGANLGQFDRTIIGGNQNHDHRGWSSDIIHHDSRSFGTINGKYTEKDNRRIHRNIENAQTYYEDNSGWNHYSEDARVTIAAQQRPAPDQNAQSNRPRNSPGVRVNIVI
ncbi:hypothetical protein K435DRAFT_528313 [Dendrothele bispora CBS 962.96]|uniref:Uncharacterized protein n=1 Tax=Dendrothele bispora (strain CBS 962.96) TaxID=1314807 RepID=A0A4S8KV95_DENBC|nr:hypothetical protein K435DRAFT_528313 [Dendrothele bispora CBS 962.96]